MPFQSRAQAGWAFATGQPFAKRWGKQTGPYKRLPIKTRKKAFTLAQLETFVSSEHYDAATAAAIAQRVPSLPREKEQLAPGISRIHGNLCNVHGRYGPCDKGMAAEGKKPTTPDQSGVYAINKPKPKKPKRAAGGKGGKGKPKAGAKPKKPKATPEQNASDVAKQMQDNDAGLSPRGVDAMQGLTSGKQPDKASGDGLVKMGLAEQAADGSYRVSSAGRAASSAMASGDYQKTVDTIARAGETAGKRTEAQGAREAKRQEAEGKRTAGQAARADAKKKREAAAAAKREAAKKKPAKAATGGGKTPAKPAAPAKRPARGGSGGGGSSGGGGGGGLGAAPKPEKPKPEKTPAPSIAQPLKDAAQLLSDGADMTDEQVQSLVRNGLAKLDKDGKPVLTSAGLNATKKDYSFRVFKDATGRYRWVAQSSTAFEDRDKEIVSTKALNDDCAYADKTGMYGPLRWWHTPGLDLGVCDFNAMHGRVLIESGTFKSPYIAQKVAQAADSLEISLGFLHLPTEPDASGVFNHIRRFERSLVPRGKASNRFTAFSVKERPMFDPTKVAALKQLGFSDSDITDLQTKAEATEKAAEEQQIAFKADEPPVVEPVAVEAAPELPDMIINGVTYKAFPPGMDKKVEEADTIIEEDAFPPAADAADAAVEEPAADEGGLTLTPEDITAIGEAVAQAIQAALGPLVSTMDLEKKVGSHMDELKAMMGGYTAKKDADEAEKTEQIAALKAQQQSTQLKLDELLGIQPEVTPRASAAPASILNPFNPADNALLAAVKDQIPADQQPYVNEFEDLKLKLFGA